MNSADLVAFCRALGDETRQQIMETLKTEGEKCVSDLVHKFNLSQPTISHHLNFLRHAGLVFSRKEGKQVYYRLNEENIMQCCGMMFTRFVPVELKLEGDLAEDE